MAAAPGILRTSIRPGHAWRDAYGNRVQAHGGSFLRPLGMAKEDRYIAFADRWLPDVPTEAAQQVSGRFRCFFSGGVTELEGPMKWAVADRSRAHHVWCPCGPRATCRSSTGVTSGGPRNSE